ncbi:MAG TPA: MlaD family protein [Solirubrobacteraceae bacterium]|nr:MlaD family protein [Solirubrobacteraceae bacterium]
MSPILDPVANARASRSTIVLAALAAGALLTVLVLLAALAPRGVPLLPYYYVEAHFANASNLRPLAAVDISGRQVGQVSQVRYVDGVADVTLQMLPGTPPLTDAATVRIRQKNPIGAKYVEVTPARRGATIPDHGVIPVSRTSTAVDTQTLLSGFNAPTRAHLTQTLDGLGAALLGRGTGINESLPLAAPELAQLQRSAAAILAVPGAAQDFAPSGDALASAYAPVRSQLAAGFRPQAAVLNDIAAEAASLRQTLQVAPGALDALRTGLAQADPLLTQVSGFARATVSLTRPAPAALAAATTLMRTGVPALRRAFPLLGAVERAVSPTLGLLDTSYPILGPTSRTLQLQMGPLTTLVAHDCDVLNETRNWRSAMSWGVPGNSDPVSHLTALEPGLGPDINSFRVLALAPTTNETLNADAPGSFAHGNDAYPAPCAANGELLR